MCSSNIIVSFPSSPHTRTKNRKERGEPGKIYHVRNVIGRENLITSGQMNELAHALWTEYTCSFAKAYCKLQKAGRGLRMRPATQLYCNICPPLHPQPTLHCVFTLYLVSSQLEPLSVQLLIIIVNDQNLSTTMSTVTYYSIHS